MEPRRTRTEIMTGFYHFPDVHSLGAEIRSIGFTNKGGKCLNRLRGLDMSNARLWDLNDLITCHHQYRFILGIKYYHVHQYERKFVYDMVVPTKYSTYLPLKQYQVNIMSAGST